MKEYTKFIEELMKDMNMFDCDCKNCKYWRKKYERLTTSKTSKTTEDKNETTK